MQNNGKEKKRAKLFFPLIGKKLACVAGVQKGRVRELGRETARDGGGRREEGGGRREEGRRGCHFIISLVPPTRSRAPKFPLPLLTPATQARKKCVTRAKFFFAN